jgi:hypothetical protein
MMISSVFEPARPSEAERPEPSKDVTTKTLRDTKARRKDFQKAFVLSWLSGKISDRKKTAPDDCLCNLIWHLQNDMNFKKIGEDL